MVVFGKTIDMIIMAIVLILILLLIVPPVFENSKSFVMLCNFVPAFCPDNVFADESTFIKYFNVEHGTGTILGGSVKVQWLLVKPSSGDELDYAIFYNSTDDDEPILANGPVTQKSGYKEMVIEFENYEPNTISFRVSSEKNPEHERKEVLWEFMPDYLESRDSFRSLNKDKISDEIFHQGGTKTSFHDYKIENDLRIVGFNKGTAVGKYGWTKEEITAPKECEGETCLCLCEKEKGVCSGERLCYEYENVDYFISERDDFLNFGVKVTYPGVDEVRYVVIPYKCLGLKWDMKINKNGMLNIEKLIRDGKTFIKIEVDT